MGILWGCIFYWNLCVHLWEYRFVYYPYHCWHHTLFYWGIFVDYFNRNSVLVNRLFDTVCCFYGS
jgi:hypothetical protein